MFCSVCVISRLPLRFPKASSTELTVTPFSPVQRHHEIRDFLNEAWDLADDFLTGSYRRDTKTKKLKDIDIFVVIEPPAPRRNTATRARGDLLSALELLLQQKWPAARRDGMAVVVRTAPRRTSCQSK